MVPEVRQQSGCHCSDKMSNHHECQDCGLILLFVAVEAELHRDRAESIVRAELDRSLKAGVKLVANGQPLGVLAVEPWPVEDEWDHLKGAGHESLNYH